MFLEQWLVTLNFKYWKGSKLIKVFNDLIMGLYTNYDDK